MNRSWPFYKKFVFLFIAVYIFLYANATQFIATFAFMPVWKKLVPIFAKAVGSTQEIKSVMSGSGDTSFDYYLILLFACLSIIASIIISILDRKRDNYNTTLKWFLIILRYFLAFQMINYGLAKIFYLQFSAPGVTRLDSTLGNISPMGLLWTFMGYSKSYTVFTGVLEFTGGILLFSRRTALLGSLVTFGVMLNVMMMNFCYDVPVKLLSTHMVFMSLILVGFQGQRLFDFFIRNKSVEEVVWSDVVSEKWISAKIILKWFLLSVYVIFGIYSSYSSSQKYGPSANKAPFVGLYEVEEFDVFINDQPAKNIRQEKQWKTFNYIVNYQGKHWAAIKYKSETKPDWSATQIDTLNNELTIKLNNTMDTFALNYVTDGDKFIKLSGIFADDSISAVLKRKNVEDYPLMSRKFSWVQERPYNR